MIEFQNSPPNWENCGTEPNNEMKKNGFKAGYKPPASIFNWFWNKTGKCIKEIQEHLSNLFDDFTNHEHSTEDVTSGTLPLKRGGTGAATAEQALKNLGITVSSALINYLSGLTSNVQTQLNSKAPSIHKHDASDTTSGTFSVNRIPNLAISKITNLQASLNAKQNNLGFTPVQQGGGTDMATNKIYIGWTGSKLKAQVDATDMGDIVTTGSANNTKLPMSKVEGLDTELDERQAGSLLAAAELIGQYRGDSIRLSSGESGEIEFPKNSAGLACVGETSSTGASGLWYFASSKNGVAVSTIINSSSITVAGAIDGNNAVLTFTNTGSPHTVGAILLYKD